jgi:uncharacterized protein (TIGR00369 family)
MEPADPTEMELRRLVAGSPFHASMGITVERVTPGEVHLTLVARPDQLNLQGLLHGGVLATLADTAAGLAVRTKLERDRRHVTIGLNVSFLSAASPGEIRARGRAVRVGRQIAYAEADITDANGKLLATAQATMAINADRSSRGEG